MASPSAIAATLTAQAQPAVGAGQMTALGSFPGAGAYNQWSSGRPYGPILPRSAEEFLSGAFGPLTPLVPMPIDEPGADGRPEPRRWQYPVGWNLPVGQPGSEGLKLASFGALRRYADIYSVVRAMINIRKDEIAGTAWDVGPTAEIAAQTKGDKGAGKDQRERSGKIVDWFKKVDPDYYGFQSWFTALLEELFVIDAVSIHLHPTRVPGKGPFGSNIAALAALNGETIRPLVDIHGATPRPPFPAYQQYLWGVPRSDLMSVITDADMDDMDDRLAEAGVDFDGHPDKQYQADQLLYLPRARRVWTPYGFSAIEQAVVPITLGLNRQQFLLDYFTEGTIPGVYVIAGESYVTPSQQRNLQDSLNALAGDVAYKHRVIVLPPGSKTDSQKDLTWAKDIDQTVIEQVAMILHIQPHEIGLTPGGRSSGLGGKGMAEQQAHAVSQQRTLPELNWWKETVFNWIIQEAFGQKDLEWKWLGWEEDEDQSQAADVATKYISVGGLSIDEDRIERGLDPWNLPLTQSPVLISGNVVTPLDPTVPAPPPPPAPGGMPGVGGPGAGGPNANDPAGAALSAAALPTKAGSDKPKDNPLANLTHEKKGKRKKARNELVDRFASNLKDQSNQIADAQKERDEDAPGGGKGDKKKDKITVAALLKWRVKYNDGKLNKIVHDYLLRSYPEKAVEWAKDGDWEYEPHVALKDIEMARRPGGRDPAKVAKIAKSLSDGASMDPVVLCQWEDGTIEPADGWHRTLGAEKAGWKDVPAFIGKGFDQYRDLITGHMQDESDSKKKAAMAELAVLRRFIRKPANKIENFRTAAIDNDVLRMLPGKVEKLGAVAAFDWAYGWVKKGGNPDGLRDWYNNGADGAINWGSDGDFMQCVDVASEHMDEDDAKGFCNLRHQDAVGSAPGTEKLLKYSDDEARDDHGRWTGGDLSGDQPIRRGESVGVHAGVHAGRTGFVAGFNPGETTLRIQLDGGSAAERPIAHIERADLHRNAEKNFSLGAPLATGLVPYDLAGAPPACQRCGSRLDADGLCPVHGVAVMKYSPDQPRDETGRWTSGGGDGSQSYATPGGNLSIGPWIAGGMRPGGSEAHTALVSMRGWRIGQIERLGDDDRGMLVASTRTGTERIIYPATAMLPAEDNALHEAAHWIHNEWQRQVKDWPDGWPQYQQAIKFDPSEMRDPFGRWSGSGGGDPSDDFRTAADRSNGRRVEVETHGGARHYGYSYGAIRDGLRVASEDGRDYKDLAGGDIRRITDAMSGEDLYYRARKFDEAEPRDDAGKWTDGGGSIRTDEGNLKPEDLKEGQRHPGRAVIQALERGESPNVHPDQVKAIMQYALNHGFKNPLDLDHVRVSGTRQFGQDGLHIRRENMPQIPPEQRDAFFKYLTDQGITITEKSINPQALQPTQDEISVQRTAEMYRAILSGDKTVTDGIISSQDKYVIDGHHRWAGYTALSFEQSGTTMRTYEIGMDAKPLLDLANKWDDQTGIPHKQLVQRGSLNKGALLAEIDAELARRGVSL